MRGGKPNAKLRRRRDYVRRMSDVNAWQKRKSGRPNASGSAGKRKRKPDLSARSGKTASARFARSGKLSLRRRELRVANSRRRRTEKGNWQRNVRIKRKRIRIRIRLRRRESRRSALRRRKQTRKHGKSSSLNNAQLPKLFVLLPLLAMPLPLVLLRVQRILQALRRMAINPPPPPLLPFHLPSCSL